MNSTIRYLLCAAVLLCGATAARPQADLPKPGEAHQTYAPNGIWTWFGDPKAIYYKGLHEKTYISWFDISSGNTEKKGKIAISSYDHASGKIETAILATDAGWDDHNHPSILVRNDGHILVFWCGHSGNKMNLAVSKNPEDVTAWETTRVILSNDYGSNFTYPNPYILSAENNRIYLFYRGIDWQQTMTWSDDGGLSWIKPFKYFAGGNRPYHKYHANNRDEILTVMDYDNRALPEHFLAIKKGGFYGADGKLVRTFDDVRTNGPIKSSDLPSIFVKGTTGNGSVWDVAEDPEGYPVFVSDSIQNGHHYWWTRWNGTKWEKKYLLNSGKEMGGEFGFACGVTLDHNNANVLYLSHWVKNSAGTDSMPELERWITRDHGSSWQKTGITANSAAMNTRPCVPRNYTGGKISVIWLYVREYGNWFGPFDSDIKMYTFGDQSSATSLIRSAPRPAARFLQRGAGLAFELRDPASASLRLFDASGREVLDLDGVVRRMSKGAHTVPVQLPAGAYVARFTDGSQSVESRAVFMAW
jgi:hypothetical protein